MNMIMFDTPSFANKLKAAGFEPHLAEAQAEAQAELMSHLIDNHLATKDDIKDIRNDMKRLEKDIRSDMRQLETKLIMKLGGIMVIGISVLATLQSVIHSH